MVIRAGDRVSSVIAQDERLIDVLVSLSPTFERLRNPAMRKVMSRLVTVEQAARMAGVDVDVVIARMNAFVAGDTPASDERIVGQSGSPAASSDAEKPAALASVPADDVVHLDVRDELRAGREPFSMIMAALRTVPPGGVLTVRATFEPVPLYAVMKRQGLDHWTERLAADDWRVWFYPAATDEQPRQTKKPEVEAAAAGDDNVILDVRGLEPPEPMTRTLEALETLTPGATLVQINERVPQFLLPLLEQRGCTYEIREQEGNVVRVFITRREG